MLHISKNSEQSEICLPISDFLMGWYENLYGDRLKRWGPGRIVILLRGIPWIIRFPKNWIFHKQHLEAEYLKTEIRSGSIDIFKYIENATPGLIRALNKEEYLKLVNGFIMGMPAFILLEMFSQNDLIKKAMGDYDAVVNHLIGQNADYGLAKWSSMQAVEKVLKYAIESKGIEYGRIHDIYKLSEQVKTLGIDPPSEILLNKVTCSPGIRYRKEIISPEQAVEIQYASLQITNGLLRQIKLKSNDN